MRFKPGQQVVCIRPNNPYIGIAGYGRGKPAIGPKYNELVTIVRYDVQFPDCVILEQYCPFNAYQEKYFAPIISDKSITELLEESLQYDTQKQMI